MAKNIVLLSDGTGNSASKEFKTNVWRLYQGVDTKTAASPQIVFYGDGVGTETFKPLAMLGLAFGVGLAKNVKDLYQFLCRNYEPGDRIFLFGFSRGAFTVRILAGLVLRCGLVTAPSDEELTERVKAAYATYKRDMAMRATRTGRCLLTGYLLGGHASAYDATHIEFAFDQYFPRIAFIGVWDTVDAYGMPVDELKDGIDRYIWPMTLADRQLSPDIVRACQALSLDDERPTFRPVLWDEATASPDRLTQVWFAGVHANVGGGYPDDGLAHAAMEWLVSEAEIAGLRLYPEHRLSMTRRVDVHGKQYDSRAGLAGYYRYGPRSMDKLCADESHDVSVERPKVHEGVHARIGRREVAYAPISFTSGAYDVVGAGDVPAAPMETAAEIDERAGDMALVWDAVFWRRVAYFATVVLTVVLVCLPILDVCCPGWKSPAIGFPGWSRAMGWLSVCLSRTAEMGLFPGWAAPWARSFARHPTTFLFAGTIVLWLFFRKSYQLQAKIQERAEYAWRRVA